LSTVLNQYYDEFRSTLDQMKIPLPWGFTRGFFLDHFEAGIGHGFIRMTFAIPLQLGMITKTKIKDGDEINEHFYTPENVKKMYEGSPAAMQRLEELVREMIERKVFK